MNLKINNLTKTFDGSVVLDNISLEINDIDSLAIIGPSGEGKTTLLRILAGLEIPDSGRVIVNGEEINFEEKQLIEYRKTVAMVFQSYNLFPHLTAYQNIALPLEKVHKLPTQEAADRTNQLLDRFGLKEHADKLPVQLSGGQRQRTAIVRALSINPQFLLLDEPTSALDPSLTASVLEIINTLKAEKKDMILVTHEMKFARRACDYCLYINDGRIAAEGKSKEIFENTQNKELAQFLNGY